MSPAGISAALVLNFLASTLCLGAEASVGRADAIDSRGGLDEREDALPDAGDYTAAVPNAWFALAYNQVRAEGLTPPVASRVFGYLGVALYESVVHGIPGSRSLQGQLNGLHGLPRARGRAYHWPTVANASLATTMRALFEGRPNAAAAIGALETQINEQFRATVPPQVVGRSTQYGQSVGRGIVAWQSTDGFATRGLAYHPCPGRFCWQPTPPAYLPALEPGWGQLRTFVLDRGSEADRGPYPAYSEDPSSSFYAAALEVRNTVNNLTPEQRTIVLYWADGPGATGTPPGHSISMTRQIIEQQGLMLDLAAEAYAKVGIAVADAFITCWWTKFHYELLRPITYIQRQIDSGWTTFIPTPNFPSYASGHSTQSGAWAQVMTDLLGEVPFTDHTHDGRGFQPRSFRTFFEAADEAAVSRLYGGIHYTFDNETGLRAGIFVGQKIRTLRFTADDSD